MPKNMLHFVLMKKKELMMRRNESSFDGLLCYGWHLKNKFNFWVQV